MGRETELPSYAADTDSSSFSPWLLFAIFKKHAFKFLPWTEFSVCPQSSHYSVSVSGEKDDFAPQRQLPGRLGLGARILVLFNS